MLIYIYLIYTLLLTQRHGVFKHQKGGGTWRTKCKRGFHSSIGILRNGGCRVTRECLQASKMDVLKEITCTVCTYRTVCTEWFILRRGGGGGQWFHLLRDKHYMHRWIYGRRGRVWEDLSWVVRVQRYCCMTLPPDLRTFVEDLSGWKRVKEGWRGDIFALCVGGSECINVIVY